MSRTNKTAWVSVIYLYPSVEAAKAGEDKGGTGFLVSVPSNADSEYRHLYAASNAHVVGKPGYSPVIRRMVFTKLLDDSTMDAEPKVLPLGINQWTLHPTADLAITSLGCYKHQKHFGPWGIFSEWLLTKDVIRILDIGPGDEVQMIGRFNTRSPELQSINWPSVRSGIISVMPYMADLDGEQLEEVFLVEMRSISGYSGSPVLWSLPLHLMKIIEMQRDLKKPEALRTHMGPWLIGIDSGNFPLYQPVYDVRIEKGEPQRKKRYDLEAKSHSGMMTVVPAWKLQELLDEEKFILAREVKDEKLKTAKDEGGHFDRDSLNADEPLTPEEFFEDFLKPSSSRVSEPESEKKQTSD